MFICLFVYLFMLKYTIEGNIDFNQELGKLLEEDSENENDDDVCQITGMPLNDKYIRLECNHHFNYKPLYNEIYKQKMVFKTYAPSMLSDVEMAKVRNSNVNYFIKCPYCRNLQFTVLPYYEEMGLAKIYGINCLENGPNLTPITHYAPAPTHLFDPNFTFTKYNKVFKFGKCCDVNTFGDNCKDPYVYTIPNTQLSYCINHYKCQTDKYYAELYKKYNDEKLEKKKKQDDNKQKTQELLKQTNAEREKQGLKPLKRLPKTLETQTPMFGCTGVLKSGVRKGALCGCMKINMATGLCTRHSVTAIIET